MENDSFGEKAPERVISLVPSLTESLFDLGLGKSVVAVTDYCVHPKKDVQYLPHVGGIKTPNVEMIIALRPDLVLMNEEENTLETFLQLKNAGVPVWNEFPKTVRQSLQSLWELAQLFRSETAVLRLDMLERSLDMIEAVSAELPRKRVFCPIWMREKDGQTEFMVFQPDTYVWDLLHLCGGDCLVLENPPERYPWVTPEEVKQYNPEVILLPDEPYPFSSEHIKQISQIYPEIDAVKNQRIIPVDGSLLTWHGTRFGKAISAIPEMLV